MAQNYIAGQWQFNSVSLSAAVARAAVAAGSYAIITAPPPFITTDGPFQPQNGFFSVTFYGFGTGTITGGAVQPQIQNGDGTFRDWGPLINISSAGFSIGFSINSGLLGAQFNITSPITGGGSLYLEIIGLLGT